MHFKGPHEPRGNSSQVDHELAMVQGFVHKKLVYGLPGGFKSVFHASAVHFSLVRAFVLVVHAGTVPWLALHQKL